MKTINKLLRTPRPYPDESFMSYLFRLTKQNGYDSISWILTMAGINKSFLNGNLYCRKPIDFTTLSKMVDIDSTIFDNMLFYPILHEEPTHCNKYAFNGHMLIRRMFNFYNNKICPYCLQELGYVHKAWNLSAVTACPFHRCILIDQCPKCKYHLNWKRNHISICECKYDWCDIHPEQIDEKEIALSTEIYSRCGFISTDKSKSKTLYPNPLNVLDLQDMLSIIYFVAGYYCGNSVVKKNILFKYYSNYEIHSIFAKTYLIFENWPEKFYEFLDYIRSKNTEHGYINGFNRFLSELRTEFLSDKYQFLIDASNKYLKNIILKTIPAIYYERSSSLANTLILFDSIRALPKKHTKQQSPTP